MKRTIILQLLMMLTAVMCNARTVTIDANDLTAESVFAELMKQTDMNFIYQSRLLDGVRVTVKAVNKPLRSVLDEIFADKAITYRIKGKNVMLMKRENKETKSANITISGFVREAGSHEALAGAVVSTNSGETTTTNANGFYSIEVPVTTHGLTASYAGFEPRHILLKQLGASRSADFELGMSHELGEIVVFGSRNAKPSLDNTETGSYMLSGKIVANTPAIIGESDIVKTLQHQPGVSPGIEGFAGLYVHGGSPDENLYTIDNVPLYQVNHLGGLFSAFNTDAIRNAEFYKSSFPARYDGRLSSFLDIKTRDGSMESTQGSLRLGTMSASFNIDGPMHRGTTSYSVAVRRTWTDLIMKSVLAIIDDDDEKKDAGYSFTDINAKIVHRFSERSQAHLMFYYGNDRLSGSAESRVTSDDFSWYDKDKARLSWGNTVISAEWRYVFSPGLFGVLTAAYSRYGSNFRRDMTSIDNVINDTTIQKIKTDNDIHDLITRADFEWNPSAAHKINFGADVTVHRFMPQRASRHIDATDYTGLLTDRAVRYNATEAGIYVGDDWKANQRLRVYAGLHASIFRIDGKIHSGLSPRLSARYTLSRHLAAKAAYSRATQYVRQLTSSFISLPTDQWVPVTSAHKPMTSDQISAGIYWLPTDMLSVSAEWWNKWQHNLLDYDDYNYLVSPEMPWHTKMTTGSGSSRGLDLKLTKENGRLTGHIAYSLMWADRRFDGINGGHKFPARFDNRHKINILANWRISQKWEINAAWTGMSGNRCTLATQMWVSPEFSGNRDDLPLKTDINNFRLPFVHRLDLGFTRNTRHGFWSFSLYNAYCHMNVVAARRGTSYGSPRFQYIKMYPIIPSVSYTWNF